LSKYLEFVEVTPTGPRKTKVFYVRSKKHGFVVGSVSWFGRWRQYVFFLQPGMVFNKDCLCDIAQFLEGLMQERKREYS